MAGFRIETGATLDAPYGLEFGTTQDEPITVEILRRVLYATAAFLAHEDQQAVVGTFYASSPRGPVREGQDPDYGIYLAVNAKEGVRYD